MTAFAIDRCVDIETTARSVRGWQDVHRAAPPAQQAGDEQGVYLTPRLAQ